MTEVPQRLSFVTIAAHDVARLRDFYVGLGWQPAIEDGDNFASFVLGGVVLGLYRIDLLTAEAAPGLEANGGWSGITLSLNMPTREEVDAVWDAWVAAGATPISRPVDREYGPRSGYLADPEGNRWEIAYADGLVLDERGAVVRFANP